jgi:hypothetical protein
VSQANVYGSQQSCSLRSGLLPSATHLSDEDPDQPEPSGEEAKDGVEGEVD